MVGNHTTNGAQGNNNTQSCNFNSMIHGINILSSSKEKMPTTTVVSSKHSKKKKQNKILTTGNVAGGLEVNPYVASQKTVTPMGVKRLHEYDDSMVQPNIQKKKKNDKSENTNALVQPTPTLVNVPRVDENSVSLVSKASKCFNDLKSESISSCYNTEAMINTFVKNDLFAMVKWINPDMVHYSTKTNSLSRIVCDGLNIPNDHRPYWWQMNFHIVKDKLRKRRSDATTAMKAAFYGMYFAT